MAGRPRGSQPRDAMLRVRVTKSGLDALDKARGGLSRSDYIRGLITKDIERKSIT